MRSFIRPTDGPLQARCQAWANPSQSRVNRETARVAQVPTTTKKLRRIGGMVRVQGVNYARNVALFCKQTIQPMIAHYRNFLSYRTESGDSSSCDTDLLAEICHVKGVLQDIAHDAETMLDVLRALKPLRAAFPRVIKLYQLAVDRELGRHASYLLPCYNWHSFFLFRVSTRRHSQCICSIINISNSSVTLLSRNWNALKQTHDVNLSELYVLSILCDISEHILLQEFERPMICWNIGII